jgi:hypothetical protein
VVFTEGQTYTREQVQDLLEVPKAQRHGNWDTGYNRFFDQVYVFANVGPAGRTGHDYDNRWEGEDFVWYAKNGTSLRQPLMADMAAGRLPIHVFWRTDNRNAAFSYAGAARVRDVEDDSPVLFRFNFGRVGQGLTGESATNGPTTLGAVLSTGSRLFAKSEFGPIGDRWPAISFSSRKIASDFASGFRRGIDFVIYIGTTDPTSTENPAHRSKVLSAITFEPNAPISTEEIVPPEAWQESIEKWGIRWEWSLPVTEGFEFDPFLDARTMMPATYARLGSLQSLGRCIPIEADELAVLRAAAVVRRPLRVRAAARRIVLMNPTDNDLRREISRVAISVQQRIEASGQARAGFNPIKTGPNLSDIMATLGERWIAQEQRCLLCERPISLVSKNPLLKMSVDRVDSADKSYDPANVHLTHLACNLGKSSATMAEWQDYVAMIRSHV